MRSSAQIIGAARRAYCKLLCRWLNETCCVFYKHFRNRRTLKLCGPAVNLPDLQYAPRAAQQDLGAQMHKAQLRCAKLLIKQGAISGCK